MQSELLKHLKNVGCTANGAVAFKQMETPIEELFSCMGASRGQDISEQFEAAFCSDNDLAVRALLYLRDCRGGMGERAHFQQLVRMLPKELLVRVMLKVPEVGYYKDLLSFLDLGIDQTVYTYWADAIFHEDALAAKWAPRKGPVFNGLRKTMDLAPKELRKMLVSLTNVVETNMCAKNWDEINFNHVPTKAMMRYKKAFNRHTTKYSKWLDDLAAGKSGAKVNVKGAYPHEVCNLSDPRLADAMWDSLPEFKNSGNILPMVDVSWSMQAHSGDRNYTCMDISVALGAFLAEKCNGIFKDHFLTFSETPTLETLKGRGITERMSNLETADWGGSTNLEAAYKLILNTAKRTKLPADQMPEVLLVLSDMQFNSWGNVSASEKIMEEFRLAGYEPPLTVFWNLSEYTGTRPTDGNQDGVMMVSGFSPTILESILNNKSKSNLEMIKDTLSNPRYDY